MASKSCGFEGDGDSYGLGVRLGAYIQWLTSVLAYNLSDTESASMRGVNTCFQIAMFAGLIVITRRTSREVYAAEAFVILLFCIGGFCSATTFPWKPKRRNKFAGFGRFGPSNIGALVRIALGAATCAYGVWFSFYGLEKMLHTECSQSAFLFAEVSLFGWARQFFKVLFVIGLAAVSVLAINSAAAVLIDCYEWVSNWTDVEDDDESAEPPTPRPSWITISLSLAALSVLVIAVELTLHWNNVKGVYSCGSTGQLFPLVVGTAGLLRLVYKILNDFVTGHLRFEGV